MPPVALLSSWVSWIASARLSRPRVWPNEGDDCCRPSRCFEPPDRWVRDQEGQSQFIEIINYYGNDFNRVNPSAHYTNWLRLVTKRVMFVRNE